MRLTGPLQGGVGFLFSLWGRVLTAGYVDQPRAP